MNSRCPLPSTPARPTICPGSTASETLRNRRPQVAAPRAVGSGRRATGAGGLVGEGGLERTADDELDDLVLGVVRDEAAADHLAVAQDRQVGGDLDDLGDAVGDVDDGDAGVEQLGDALEQPPGLFGAKSLGGLVEHQDGGVGCERRRDLDQVRLAQ